MSGVIGTGGHIDHGKTALVAALTGVDTDRLPEEKRRGISIDLGFSRLDLEDGTHAIVDVPGHEDFIRNMLAGATGIDVFLLVVAADEGVMPQTREHVAIATLLEVPTAVVALTKTDLVEPEWLALVREDVQTFLDATPFAGAPLVDVASPVGKGIDALRAELARALSRRSRPGLDLFRLPVDRAFTVKGTGTVVTGTVWSGTLARDATVRIEPGGTAARVRSLQVHGVETEVVHAGDRAAVALTGVDRDRVPRGSTLVDDPEWEAASILTVRLRVIRDTRWVIRQRQRVRVHLGTAEAMARVRLLDAREVEPGAEAWAQLRLESPLLARAGDRFVIRSYSPVTTIAGGIVAEPDAPKRRRLEAGATSGLLARVGPDPGAAVRAVVESAGAEGVPVARLTIDAGARPERVREVLGGETAIVAGGRAFPASAAAAAREAISGAVRSYHDRWPLRVGAERDDLRRAATGHPALVEWAIDRLIDEGTLANREGRVADPRHAPRPDEAQQKQIDALMAAFDHSGLVPLDGAALAMAAAVGEAEAAELLAYLVATGDVVRIPQGAYFRRGTAESLARTVRERLGGRTGLGPAEFREVLDLSRKHLIPILEYLDQTGITIRHGEGRSVLASAPEA